MSDLNKLGTACAFNLNEQEKTIGRLHGELAAKDAELTAAIIGRDQTIKELRNELEKVHEAGRLVLQACATACKERDAVRSEIALLQKERDAACDQLQRLRCKIEGA